MPTTLRSGGSGRRGILLLMVMRSGNFLVEMMRLREIALLRLRFARGHEESGQIRSGHSALKIGNSVIRLFFKNQLLIYHDYQGENRAV